ncbi:4Fe-4S binding protein [Methanococcus voltae]|uniref:Ferredoxin n=1 Tax=Methanococcus voltae TaxID=2188 RepID=A0A8J7RIU7_METVO|nr:4Fe-4S binding protein [Methanococcus voltae]MBP2172874.1 ferredoxin [Methanococcus voltae]MBP2201716.1 ferredoxin [Methanococcus voltae]
MIKIKKPVDELVDVISKDLKYTKEEIKGQLTDGLKIPLQKNLYIQPKKCVHCELCLEACPVNAIEKPNLKNSAKIISEKCIKCEICAKTCPVGAIEVLMGEAFLDDDNENVIYNIEEMPVEHRKLKLVKHNLDMDKCIKCAICERFCAPKAINVERKVSIDVNEDLCMGCTACEKVCPVNAITVDYEISDINFEDEFLVDNDKCIDCMVCYDLCPVSAISYNGKIEIDEKTCVHCSICEKNCPVSAISKIVNK